MASGADPAAEGDGLGALLGLEHLEREEDGRAAARLTIDERHRQPYGHLHGGVYAAIAESICSRATFAAVQGDGRIAMGQSNQTTFLRPIDAGHVNAEARARHRGRTTWVWEVEFTDDQGRLCALTQMTVAVRQASRQG